MAKVGIVMGSDSDMPVMSKAADMLEKFGIDYEMTIISAHREPDVFFEYAKTAEAKGFKVIIAGAGMAAHLPGMCAAIFPMPVIGIPMHTTSLGGRDSLYSIVQMPSGIPVATVAINGGANAGILAAKILATSDPELLEKVKAYAAESKRAGREKGCKAAGDRPQSICGEPEEIKKKKLYRIHREDYVMDYKKAGVDIEAGYKSVELMKRVREADDARGSAGGTRRIFRGIFSCKDLKTWKSRCCSPVQMAVGTKGKTCVYSGQA